MAKILVVDDEPLTIDMLTAYLDLLGHESVGALSGRQTWDILAYQKPDLILLDIMLPDTSGIDICREMRTKPEWADVPIVMISAHSPPMIEEATQAGANDYLKKPINLNNLKDSLKRNGIG
ncbi:MAG: response regulator [Chloroflexi bacterium]|nr:MAG: response regulator [Chloroflexota bacterium]